MYFYDMDLKLIRKAARISIKDTGLNSRTVKKIESGDDSVSVANLKKYLESVGLKIIFTI